VKRIIIINFVLSFILLFNSCDTPFKEYKPQNEDEKQVIALLDTYLDARNNGDPALLQSIFHDDGVYNSPRGGIFTKIKIKEIDPKLWVQYGKVSFFDPEVTVNGDEGKVMVTENHGGTWETLRIFTFTKTDNKWLVMKVE
jgi:hypothetical protein